MSAKQTGFFTGIILFLAVLLSPVYDGFVQTATGMIAEFQVQTDPALLARSMQSVLALLLLMVSWWLTEAVPLPATALLPAILLPLLEVYGLQGGTAAGFTFRTVLANYANPVIYLFLGGFLIAAAMQKWGVARRFTLWFLTRGNMANDTRKVLFGIMCVTAFLSMWMSDTATAAMMLPLGLGILGLIGAEPGNSRYGTALMLGIAWASLIGGIGTMIGTPPNGIAIGILNTTLADNPAYDRITFFDWMKFGVPYVILFLPVAWFIVLKMNPPEIITIPGGKARFEEERSKLGPLSTGEKRTILVFILVVLCWTTNPFWESILPNFLAVKLQWVDEYMIGLFFGVSMFFVPVSLKENTFVLNWTDTKKVDWGTLILFGGGIALSDAMFKTGLASFIASNFISLLGEPSTLVMIFAVVLLVDFLTEITSNTAVTSMLVPIFISIALQTGENPVALAVAAALAASLAFMLPVATPPNALVFGTGYIQIKDMIRSGFMMDIIGWIFTTGVIVILANWVFGVIVF